MAPVIASIDRPVDLLFKIVPCNTPRTMHHDCWFAAGQFSAKSLNGMPLPLAVGCLVQRSHSHLLKGLFGAVNPKFPFVLTVLICGILSMPI